MRTIMVPGSTLKVGDVVISTGYRFQVLTQPFIRRTLSGAEQYYFSARSIGCNLPPGYDNVTMSKSIDSLWTVEAQ